LLISGAIIGLLLPPAEYLPEGEEPKIFAVMNAPPGYNLNAMRAVGDKVEARLLPHVETDPGAFHRGEAAVPAMKYMNFSINAQRVRLITEPRDPADMDPLMDALTRVFEDYPGMRAFVARGSIITSNDGGTRSINLDISGPELEAIYRVAGLAELRAREIFERPRIQSQPRSLSLAQPLLQLRPRWERAAELGISNQALGFAVSALTDGTFVDEFFLDDDKIDIYLYSDSGLDVDMDGLGQAPLYTPNGEIVPLGALVDFEETVDTSSIRRVGGRRTVTLNIIPPREVALEEGVRRVHSDLVEYLQSRGDIPAEVSITISGAADQLDATQEALVGNYLVALFIVYLLMVAIFNHWGYPLLIMSSLPVGVAGGLLGLALLNTLVSQPFDMISMLGFLILMGTVVNNPILVVHRAVENFNAGSEARDAVREAIQTRLRPIAMSTITTLCGLAPLVLIPGAGTELYRGVGVIVMFGILGAMLVTLTMLPALTTLVLEWQEGRRK
jgi:multidrug efflux pump subunit AcrB